MLNNPSESISESHQGYKAYRSWVTPACHARRLTQVSETKRFPSLVRSGQPENAPPVAPNYSATAGERVLDLRSTWDKLASTM